MSLPHILNKFIEHKLANKVKVKALHTDKFSMNSLAAVKTNNIFDIIGLPLGATDKGNKKIFFFVFVLLLLLLLLFLLLLFYNKR